MAKTAKTKKTEEETPVDGDMTKDRALKIISEVAEGKGNVAQLKAASEWLRINGQGQVFARHVLTVVHTYQDKPMVNIPKPEIPKTEK